MTTDITWNEYIDATALIREANNALARLIADTLTAQYDGAAAYLVLDEDESADFMGLVSVLDAEGSCLFTFSDDTRRSPHCRRVPRSPTHGAVTTLWSRGRYAEPFRACTRRE